MQNVSMLLGSALKCKVLFKFRFALGILGFCTFGLYLGCI